MAPDRGTGLPQALDQVVDHVLATALGAPTLSAESRARILARLRPAATAAARPRRWRLSWLVVPALAAAALILVFVLRRPVAGVVSESEASVTLVRQGRTGPVAAGDVLRVGDIVRTGGGRARLQLGRRTTAALGTHTELGLPSDDDVRLGRGHAVFEVSWTGAPFRVLTPTGTVTVTGTRFEVTIVAAGPSGSSALVHLLEGSVLVEGPTGRLALAPDQTALLTQAAPPRLAKESLLALRQDPKPAESKPLPDCTRTGGPECEEIANAVSALRAMEDQLTDAEKRALAEASGEAEAQALPGLQRLYAEVTGGRPSAGLSHQALVQAITEALPPDELKQAFMDVSESQPSSASPARRLVGILNEVADTLRNELARRVPLHRVSPITSSRWRKNEGGKR